jgi:hypothetical protein
MDGQHLDRIARSLARGMSRRGVMKTVAVALGVAATGTLRSAHAAPDLCRCLYRCGDGPLSVHCVQGGCRGELFGDPIRLRGELCVLEREAACNFSSKESCEFEA